MKKLFQILVAFLVLGQYAIAQVPKKVVVEHFTNTKCSVCASRNPGFYTNLNSQTGVIHLAIHPSSPYAGCVLNQHNTTENDARTNYYGVFGGTPRLVIQGVVISGGANYNSAAIFNPYLGQTSPVSIKIMQSKYGNDSISSRIVIKTEATHTLANLKLFVALAEDTVFYTGSNGEPKHFDVFRKSLTGISGISVTAPVNVGDSNVYVMSSPANSSWNFSRIFTLAILQDGTTREVIQSESIQLKSNPVASGISTFQSMGSSIHVFIKGDPKNIYINQTIGINDLYFTLYDVSGRKLLNERIESESEMILTDGLSPGIYLFVVTEKNNVLKTGKLLVN